MNRPLALAGCSLCLAIAVGLFGEQGYLSLKARLADHLIAHAFQAHLRDGGAHRPWSWADTHPIGKLEVPRLGVERILLAGASGASLAFGVGHLDGTAAPNTAGNCCIAGHRDTVFGFLGEVRVGDLLWVETHEGRVAYRVARREVRSMWDANVLRATEQRRLTLITCWPLDEWRPGPERLVVVAEAEEETTEGEPLGGPTRRFR